MWAQDAVVYHVYALGACRAPYRNDGHRAPVRRLDRIVAELDRLHALGITTLLLGPVFQAMSHGYDTVDYTRVDNRLGDNQALRRLSAELADRGMNLMLDAVLNHVGRDFFAFADVRANGPRSRYADWFDIDFNRRNSLGDGFTYRHWGRSPGLVCLNLEHPAVVEYLLDVVDGWVAGYNLAGLRLDAANVMRPGFLATLAGHVRTRWPDLWLVGEQVEGDYRTLVRTLGSVTNYWAFDSLWRAHRDHDYRLLADCLDRQFGPWGRYLDVPLLNFADNHDVTRIASNVGERACLYPLYGILATMPGVPSIYYGSEWAIPGVHAPGRDRPLRPAFDAIEPVEPDLPAALARILAVRREFPALRHGDYRTIHVSADQMAFRRTDSGTAPILVAVNNSPNWAPIPLGRPGSWWDHLEPESVDSPDGNVWVPPHWLRILTRV